MVMRRVDTGSFYVKPAAKPGISNQECPQGVQDAPLGVLVEISAVGQKTSHMEYHLKLVFVPRGSQGPRMLV
eukprot:2417834-Alexandrium_andersonii.AAC.1